MKNVSDRRSYKYYLSSRKKIKLLSCGMRVKKLSEFVLIIFYIQLINISHAETFMAVKNRGKLSCLR